VAAGIFIAVKRSNGAGGINLACFVIPKEVEYKCLGKGYWRTSPSKKKEEEKVKSVRR
jgi:hypothetical protein